MQNILVKTPIVLRGDWSWHWRFNLTWNSNLLPKNGHDYIDWFMVLTVYSLHPLHAFICRERFTVPTVSPSQPSAHILIWKPEGISAFIVALVLVWWPSTGLGDISWQKMYDLMKKIHFVYFFYSNGSITLFVRSRKKGSRYMCKMAIWAAHVLTQILYYEPINCVL